MNNLVEIILVALIFGFSNKLADLMNEHGLFWAKCIDILFGIIWGISAAFLIIQDSSLATYYLSLILYWFLMLKLDYPNHAIAGVIVLLVGIQFVNTHTIETIELTVLTVINYLTGLLNNYLKNKTLFLDKFIRLRLKIYLIPLLYSIYLNNYLPILVTLCGMIGVEITTLYYKQKGYT